MMTSQKSVSSRLWRRARLPRPLDGWQRGRVALRLYQRMVEDAPLPVLLVDALHADLPVVYANAAFEQMTGYTRAEALGRNCRFLQGDDREQPSLEDVREALRTQRDFVAVVRNYRKDGSLFWNEMRVSPMRDAQGKVCYYMAILNDVTERIAREEALRESHQRYDDLVSNIPALVYRVRMTPDLEIQFEYLSPRCKEFTGYEVEEALADPSLLTSNLAPEDNAAHWELMLRSRETLEPYLWEGPATIAGQKRWIRLESRARRMENGDVVWEGLHTDITGQVMAQQQAFDIALEKEKMQIVASFIQNAAHEFRTPLSIISTNAYLLERLNDAQRRAPKVEQVQAQVRRIAHLLDMMLTVVRLESEKSSQQGHHILALAEIAASLVAEFGMSRSGGPIIRYQGVPYLPPVMGNPQQITQALWQIIANACHFSPPDGQVIVSTGTLANDVWVDVQDEGPGIVPDEVGRIFESFWRHDEAHSTAGFGLGLTIARRVAELHNGQILVYCPPEGGTRFRLLLPIAAT
jgi:PAS domain S-box-containing protein